MSFKIYHHRLNNRMILGTALYPSLEIMSTSIQSSKVEMVTVSLKRQLAGNHENHFWLKLQEMDCIILPNTAGCRYADEAVATAEMAREIFNTNLIKLELIGDDYTLHPNILELLKATEILIDKGFKVLPYCTDDLIVCKALVSLGCEVLMPLAAPIGSGKGILNSHGLSLLRERLKDTTLIVDAGIGTPSDAVKVMELGYDGVLLNSAVALAEHPEIMAHAFSLGIQSGHLAYHAKRMPKRNLAFNSTPLVDTPFWQQKVQ